MAFTQDTFAPINSGASPAPSTYTYSTGDDDTVVQTVGYFDAKKNQLEKGDILFCNTLTGFGTFVVKDDTSTVEKVVGPTSSISETVARNDGIDVLTMNDNGDEEKAPVSSVDIDDSILEYSTATREFKVKSDGLHQVILFSNANESAGTADIVFVLVVADTPGGPYTAASGAFLREYNTDGGTLAISSYLELDSSKYYAILLRNDDGGNVTYTTDTYNFTTDNVGAVNANAFTFQCVRF